MTSKPSESDKTDISQAVAERKKKYKADAYSMSVGELVSVYEKGELVINPTFQRYFRWNNLQKSRLIESILLGIPLPSFFVYQNDKGIWELVDGLQRFSTFLELMGKLPDGNGHKKPYLKLLATELLPELKDFRWKNQDDATKELPLKLQLDIKRARVDINIIENESDADAKYEVFQRLNTGGSALSPQELRNVIAVMMDEETYNWLLGLARDENFQNTVAVSERLSQEQYDVELALRHLAFIYFDFKNEDIDPFLDRIIRVLCNPKVSQPVSRDEMSRKFRKTFKLINMALGENAFAKYDGHNFGGKFLESSFEAISFGIHLNVDSYTDTDTDTIIEKIRAMWSCDTFKENRGTGSYARKRIPALLAFGRSHFARHHEK